jgi:molecular chaperone GrpE
MNDDEIKNKINNTAGDTLADDVEIVVDEGEDLAEKIEELSEENMAATVKKLRGRLKESQAKSQEYMTGWQRAKADYVNARRLEEESRAEFLKYAERKMLLELLALADSFDMALADVGEAPSDKNNWLAGVKNIRSQLEKILQSHGVHPMAEAIGSKFDPTRHEALASEPVASIYQDDMVLAELMRGYEIHDKVLRPAKVKVGEFKNK